MYDLPTNPTARDILTRSIECDSGAFRAALIELAEAHDSWASFTNNERGRQGAVASFKACLSAYDIIGRDDMSTEDKALFITSDCGTMITALNVACKLQDLPAHVRTQAAIAA
jgi:hypothetical protein